MATISIGFSTPKEWMPFAALIRASEQTPYSHSYVRIPAPRIGEDLIYQASSTRVNFWGGTYFDDNEKVIKEFILEISDEAKFKLLQRAIRRLGKPYGVKQVVGMGCVIVARWFGKRIKNPFADGEDSYVCSEIVWEVLEELGIEVGVDRDVATPKDIFQALENHFKT